MIYFPKNRQNGIHPKKFKATNEIATLLATELKTIRKSFSLIALEGSLSKMFSERSLYKKKRYRIKENESAVKVATDVAKRKEDNLL